MNRRLPWQPIALALAALGTFHLVIALANPGYWTAGSWDEPYYLTIAERGYSIPREDYLQFGTTPFSPGWPMLLRLVHGISGIPLAPLRLVLAALGCIAGSIAVWHCVARAGGDVREQFLTVLFVLFWPGGVFLCSGYAEALYFPLLAFFLLAVMDRRWHLATWLATLALFVRTPAAILLVVLGISFLIDAVRRVGWRRGLLASLGAAAWMVPIALLAPISYMAILWADTGYPNAFLRAYDAWAPHLLEDGRNLTFQRIAEGVTLHFAGQPGRWLGMFFCLLAPVVLLLQRLRLRHELALLAWIAWFFFLTQDVIEVPYTNMLRWLGVIFPIHLAWVRTLRPMHLVIPAAGACIWLFVYSAGRFVTGGWLS